MTDFIEALTKSERGDRAKARIFLMQAREYAVEMYLSRKFLYCGLEHSRQDNLYTGIELIRIAISILKDYPEVSAAANYRNEPLYIEDLDEKCPTIEMVDKCIVWLGAKELC